MAAHPKLVSIQHRDLKFIVNASPMRMKGMAHGLRLQFVPYERDDEDTMCIRLMERATAELMWDNNKSLIIVEEARGQELLDRWDALRAGADGEKMGKKAAFRKAFEEVMGIEAPSLDETQTKEKVEKAVHERLKAMKITVRAGWPLWWKQMICLNPALQWEDYRKFKEDPAENIRQREAEAAKLAAEARRRGRIETGTESTRVSELEDAVEGAVEERKPPKRTSKLKPGDPNYTGPILRGNRASAG